jgi:hypothetical protein
VSLLQICYDVVDGVGVPRPPAIVTGIDQFSRQLYAVSKYTLEELSLMDWPVLVMPGNVTTVVGQETYPLPADFEHEINDTMYSATRYEQIRGSLTPGDWARQRRALSPDIGQYRFRIYGNPLMIHLIPIPQMVENLVYEYKTTNRVRRVDSSLGATYGDDQDVSLVPEELVRKGIHWRIRRAKGLDYSEEFDDYEIARNSRLAQQLAFGSMPVAIRNPWGNAPITDGYVPEWGYGP